MQINRQPLEKHTIQSYTDTEITINNHSYQQSLIVSHSTIITPWSLTNLADMTHAQLEELLALKPEVIVMGCEKSTLAIPYFASEQLAKQRIGIEHMSIGSACRTFNVLLSEERVVVGGFIFQAK